MNQTKQWICGLKKLPNKKSGFASGLCSSGALALAVIVYSIVDALGYKLGMNWLIGFIAVAEVAATIVFFTWAKAAHTLKQEEKRTAVQKVGVKPGFLDSSNSPRIESDDVEKKLRLETLQQKSKQIIRAAAFLQVIAIVIVGSILYLKPSGYKGMGLCFSIIALLSSFAASRWYIYNVKKIEAMKAFSDEESRAMKNEYLFRFFAPYLLWGGCLLWVF